MKEATVIHQDCFDIDFLIMMLRLLLQLRAYIHSHSSSHFIKKMGWNIGFEPMRAGITIRCVNPFANPTIRRFAS